MKFLLTDPLRFFLFIAPVVFYLYPILTFHAKNCHSSLSYPDVIPAIRTLNYIIFFLLHLFNFPQCPQRFMYYNAVENSLSIVQNNYF